MPKQEVINPVGIVTQPNKLGVYPPGALATAQGVVLRGPALLENHGAFSNPYGAAAWAGFSSMLVLVRPANSSQYPLIDIYADFSGTPQWFYGWGELGAGDNLFRYTPDPVGSGFEVFSHFSSASSNNRTLVAMRDSVACFDCNPNVTTPTPRLAGMVTPHFTLNQLITGTNAGALANKQHCHAIAVLRRVLWDGTELVSAPTPAVHIFAPVAAGGPVNIQYKMYGNFGAQTGDYIDFYRTRSQPIDTSTGTSTNTGADYFKSVSYQVPAGFFGGGTFTVTDTVQDGNLGDALYTNPGVRGEGAANYMPPVCRAVCSFKGYTFFLGVTDAPSITLRVGVGWGNFVTNATGATPYVRQFGIGTRYVTGNTTSGGTQITSATAADLVGVVIGQQVIGGIAFSGTLLVSSIVGTTVSFTGGGTFTATQTGGTIQIADVIEIDGTRVAAGSFNAFVELVAGNQFAAGRPTLQVACQDLVLPLQGGFGTTFTPDTAPADSFTIFRPTSANGTPFGSMTIRATNGANYSPPLPAIESGATALTVAASVRGNFAQWSELNQPEAAPDANRFPIGKGDLLAGVETRDAMYIFATDGLWRLSGTGGRAGDGFDWRVDPVDSSLLLAGDASCCVLQDIVYAYTTRGIVAIDSSGTILDLSRGRIGDVNTLPPAVAYTPSSMSNWMVSDKVNNEIVFYDSVKFPNNPWVYNQLTDAFTQYNYSTVSTTIGSIGHAVSTKDGRLLIATLAGSGGCYVILPTPPGSVLSVVLYQPFYGNDPWSKRHWQRVNFVFDNPKFAGGGDATVSVNALVNDATTTWPASGVLTVQKADLGQDFARVSYAIHRNAPAIANHIQLGWRQTGNQVRLRFYGLEVDAIDITAQRVRRG